jgi:hypothetical protein
MGFTKHDAKVFAVVQCFRFGAIHFGAGFV